MNRSKPRHVTERSATRDEPLPRIPTLKDASDFVGRVVDAFLWACATVFVLGSIAVALGVRL